jgi:single-stranded-DNA-specific exonuclease
MHPKPSCWATTPYDVATARRLAGGLGLSSTLGTILARRGFTDLSEARSFIDADVRHDPLSLPGAATAAELIRVHLERASRIAVFGDYDVDGVCATALLVTALRASGADPVWELPSRFDGGYGLSVDAVERLAGRGVGLLVTVDCGITATEPVRAARAAGIDVVVTDHHRAGPELPACPIVHPSAGEERYPADLCGTGVALKLVEALGGPEAGEEAHALAALATVCDLVPLRGENRRIVREGLQALARTRSPGLRALMAVSGTDPAELSEHALGFRLGPRINAAGRMGRADAALELLLTDNEARAAEVARELDLLNSDRRETETRILFQAEAACAPQASEAAMVVAGEGWHPGVVGIVASRLVERWRRPVVVIALDDSGGTSRGSGRSISAYDLHAGITACAEHLERFGGHPMAAGVELTAEAVEPFRRALAAHAGARLSPSDLVPVERVDAVVPGGALGLELAEQIDLLRPFGAGNPQPTLLVPAARLENVAAMGEERQHARFTLVTGTARARGVSFGTTQTALTPGAREPHHAAVRLEANRWNGCVEPRVLLRALCPPAEGVLSPLGEEGSFWERLEAELRHLPVNIQLAPAGDVEDRRGEGFAGVTGDLLTSGERVLVVVADVPRRSAALEARIAGLGSGPLAVASWEALARRPDLAAPFEHLAALDPPPRALADPLLRLAPHAHAAWGPAEASFALEVWRAGLELRPALTAAYRALREGEGLEAALRGTGHYPRGPELCARLVRVLTELGLAEIDLAAGSGRVVDGIRSNLELSPSFRSYRERFAAIEAALSRELPTPVREQDALARAS